MKRKLIAPGEVDDRSIIDVKPAELRGFTQCHFFAGEGIWSLALRNAGWPDDRPVWTGSCPCQPFSAAGKGDGFADERHLWPAWFHLIAHGKPRGVPVYGEQVASKDGLAWFDLVHADLEGQRNTVGAVDTCAAGFGAPHIRQRLFFVANAECDGRQSRGYRSTAPQTSISAAHRFKSVLGDTESSGSIQLGTLVNPEGVRLPIRKAGIEGGTKYTPSGYGKDERCGWINYVIASEPCFMDDPKRYRWRARGIGHNSNDDGLISDTASGHDGLCPTNGFWRDADWLLCRDGKWRAVEPGTFPLAHGAAARVGRLRLHGNGIVEAVARGFIEASQN